MAMKPEIREILTNAEAIAVDQDTLQQGRRVRKDGPLEVWAKKLTDGSQAVILSRTFHRPDAEISFEASVQGLRDAERTLSASRLKAIDVTKIIAPGNAAITGWFQMALRRVASISPHSGVGGRAPRPMKERPAARMIDTDRRLEA